MRRAELRESWMRLKRMASKGAFLLSGEAESNVNRVVEKPRELSNRWMYGDPYEIYLEDVWTLENAIEELQDVGKRDLKFGV